MPGAEYEGHDPHGFMSLAEVAAYFDNYVKRFDLHVHCGARSTYGAAQPSPKNPHVSCFYNSWRAG